MSSPKVIIKEQDASKSAQNPATGIVGYAGIFQKGDVFKIIRQSNERQFVSTFGKPNNATFKHFYTVQNFLNYASNIDVVRVVDPDTALNSGIMVRDATGTPDANSDYIDDHENYTQVFTGDEELAIYAKDPGAWGNNIKIAIANYTDFSTADVISGVSFASTIDVGPEDTDEIAIVVIDNTDGDNEIVESFIVSLTEDSKDSNGVNNYIEEKINGSSSYILAFLKSSTTDIESFEATAMSLGADGDTPTDGHLTTGYNLFADKESVEVNYLVSGGNESDVVRKLLNTIATARKDCMAFIGSKQADIVGVSSNATIVTNLTDDISTLAINSSYSAYFGNYMQIYDAYNDRYRWVGITGEVVGLKVSVNENNESWFAGAGFNRGILQGPQKLGFSPDESQRDTLYKNRINPIYKDTASGFVVLGQKTLLASSSTFNRINVREVFIYCEKALGTLARDFLFEFNDDTTRNLFRNASEAFLRDVLSRRGIVDFKVVCDETNNTAQVISGNNFVADVAIKANIVAEFITLTFYNVGPGVEFSEVV